MPETEEPEHAVTCGEIQTIEFKDVTFAYPSTERKILEHFNYVIHKGDQIGIAGESGAGNPHCCGFFCGSMLQQRARS